MYSEEEEEEEEEEDEDEEELDEEEKQRIGGIFSKVIAGEDDDGHVEEVGKTILSIEIHCSQSI